MESQVKDENLIIGSAPLATKFVMGPTSITMSSFIPKYDTLSADVQIDDFLYHRMNSADLDMVIKDELAKKLADAIVSSKLMDIYEDRDIETMTHKFRGQIKVMT